MLSWLRNKVRRSSSKKTQLSSRWKTYVPLLEHLEDRLAPAVTSSFTANALVLTYDGANNNDAITIQATAANDFLVTPTGGTHLDGGTVAEAFNGAVSITVNGAAGTNSSVTFDSNSQSVSLTGTISVTAIDHVTLTDTTGTGSWSASSQSYANAVTLGADTSLLGGAISLPSVAGGGHALALNAGAGTITATGAIDNVSTLTVTNSGGATFQGGVGTSIAGAVTLSNTTGTITFQGATTHITTLTTAAQGYSVALDSTNTTIDTSTTFNNTGTVELGGSLQLSAAFSVSGDFTNNGTLDLNSFAFTVDGNLTNNGTIKLQGGESVTLPNGNDTAEGTWIYYGDNTGNTLTISTPLSFFNLTIDDQNASPDTFSPSSGLSVAGAFTISGGTYDASGQTANVTGLTTVTGGATNGGTYDASTATQTLSGGLTVTAGTQTGTFSGSTGDVSTSTVSISGGTLTAPTGAFDVSADWTFSSGTFNNSSATVTFNGTSGTQTITSGGADFFDLTHSGNDTLTQADDLTADGSFNNSNGTYTQGANDLSVAADFSLGNGTTFNNGAGSGNNLNLTNTGNLTDNNATKQDLGNVVVTNGTRTLTTNSQATTVTVSGGTFDANTHNMTVSGLTKVNGGTYKASTGTQSLNGGLTVSAGAFTGSTGTVSTTDVNLSATGTLTAPTTGGTFNVSGNWAVTGGTFTPGTGTVTFTKASGTQTLNSGGQSFNNVTHSGAGTLQLITNALTVSGALDNSNASGTIDLDGQGLSVTGTVTNVGTIKLKGIEAVTLTSGNDITKGTWLYYGDDTAGTITIKHFTGAADYFNLTIDDQNGASADTYTPAADLVVAGSFSLQGGTFAQEANNFSVAANFSLSNGTTFTKATGAQTLTLTSTGNLTDNNATPQDLGALVVSGGTRTLTTSIDASSVSVTGTATLVQGHNDTLSVSGNFSLANGTTFTKDTGTGTLTFTATGNLTDNNATLQDLGALVVSGGTRTLTTSIDASSISVTGTTTLVQGNNDTLSVSGNFSLANGTTFTKDTGTGTLTFSGTGNLTDHNTILQDLGNVVVSGGTRTLTTSIDASSVSVTGGTLVQGTNDTLTVSGNFSLSNSTTFTKDTGTGTLTFSGTGNLTDHNATLQDLGNVVVSGGTRTLTTSIDASSVSVTGTATLVQGNNDTLSVSGNFSLANGTTFTKDTGTGTLTFSGTGNLTDHNTILQDLGNVVVSGGTRTLTTSIDASSVSVTGGTLVQGTNDTLTVSGNFSLSNSTTFTKDTGTGTLTFSGTGNLTDNNATLQDLGNVVVSGGTRTLTTSIDASSVSVTGTATLVQGNNDTLSVSGNFSLANGTTFTKDTGTGTLTFSGTGNLTDHNTILQDLGNVVVSGGTRTLTTSIDASSVSVTGGTLVQGTNDTLTVSGNFSLSNSTTFTKDTGTGTLTFSGTGNLTDNNATLQDLGNVVVSGGTRTMKTSIDASSVSVTGTATLVQGNNDTLSVSGNFSLANGTTFTKDTGTGTLTFSGTGNLTDHNTILQDLGNVVVSGGTRTLTTSIDASSVSVTGGTLVQGTNDTLTVSGNFSLSNSTTFTKDTGTGTLTFSGTGNLTDNNATLQDLGNVVVSGGTRTLQSTNIKADSATITGGTLLVNMHLECPVTLSGTSMAGAILAGTGTVNGIGVASGMFGTVNPGPLPIAPTGGIFAPNQLLSGILTSDGDVTLSANVNLLVRLNGKGTVSATSAVLPAVWAIGTPTVISAGSNYRVNDILNVIGGVFTTRAQLVVRSVNSKGAITSVAIYQAGAYTTAPTSPVQVFGGNGTGAAFALSFNSFGGTGYKNGETVDVIDPANTGPAAKFKVTVINGVITGITSVVAGGAYGPPPSNPVFVKGETSGATTASFNITWGDTGGAPAAGTDYDQLSVTGNFSADEALLSPTLGSASSVGDVFTFIDTDAVKDSNFTSSPSFTNQTLRNQLFQVSVTNSGSDMAFTHKDTAPVVSKGSATRDSVASPILNPNSAFFDPTVNTKLTSLSNPNAPTFVQSDTGDFTWTFTDPDELDTHSVNINYGDGRTSLGTITGPSPTFPTGTTLAGYTITAKQAFPDAVKASVVASVFDGEDTGTNSATPLSVTVDDAPLIQGTVVQPITTNYPINNAPPLFQIATFEDDAPSAHPAGSFEVKINWGDGSSADNAKVMVPGDQILISTSTAANGQTVYTLYGAHIFNSAASSNGRFILTIQIISDGLSSVNGQSFDPTRGRPAKSSFNTADKTNLQTVIYAGVPQATVGISRLLLASGINPSIQASLFTEFQRAGLGQAQFNAAVTQEAIETILFSTTPLPNSSQIPLVTQVETVYNELGIPNSQITAAQLNFGTQLLSHGGTRQQLAIYILASPAFTRGRSYTQWVTAVQQFYFDQFGQVASVTVPAAGLGSGYTTPTLATQGGGSNLTYTLTVVNGVVTSLTLGNGGTGYTGGTWNITGDGGTGATAIVTVDPTTGNVTNISLASGGSGYQTPTITFNGAIGSGLGGSGATAFVTVQGNQLGTGKVINVTVTNNGKFYPTTTTYTISGNNGTSVTKAANVTGAYNLPAAASYYVNLLNSGHYTYLQVANMLVSSYSGNEVQIEYLSQQYLKVPASTLTSLGMPALSYWTGLFNSYSFNVISRMFLADAAGLASTQSNVDDAELSPVRRSLFPANGN